MSDKNHFGTGVENNYNSVSWSNPFPLHTAAKERKYEVLEELLSDKNIDVNAVDNKGNTILHILLSEVCSCMKCRDKVTSCVKRLIEKRADINKANHDKEVPLYLAVKNDLEECARELLQAEGGADTTVKVTRSDKTLGQYILEKLPMSLAEVLDKAVKREGGHLMVDFSCLLQYSKNSKDKTEENDETKFLYSLLGISNRTNFFEHPVTELFMRLKYYKLQWVVFLTMFMHIVTLIFYTSYIYYLYVVDCPYDENRKAEYCIESFKIKQALLDMAPKLNESDCIEACDTNEAVQYMSYVLGVILLSMIVTEGVVMKHRFQQRKLLTLITKSTCVWFVFYVLMAFTLWPSVSEGYYIRTWRYPIAALGVWLVWALCIQQLYKIPKLSVYFIMFTKISFRVLMMALLFFPLLVGFTVGFRVMDAENIDEAYSFLTLISTTIGEPNYDDFFTKDRERSIVYTGIAMLLYLLFVLLMCVVFVNFLLGMTMNNIDELWKESEISSQKEQIRLMHLFDRLNLHRMKIFTPEQVRDNNLVYEVPVKYHPTFIPRTLVRKLKLLSRKHECNTHKSKQMEKLSKRSKLGSQKGNFSREETIQRDDQTQIIIEAIQNLEKQLNDLTRSFQNLEANNII